MSMFKYIYIFIYCPHTMSGLHTPVSKAFVTIFTPLSLTTGFSFFFPDDPVIVKILSDWNVQIRGR